MLDYFKRPEYDPLFIAKQKVFKTHRSEGYVERTRRRRNYPKRLYFTDLLPSTSRPKAVGFQP